MIQDLQHKIESFFARNSETGDREILYKLKQLLYEAELQNMPVGEAKDISGLVDGLLQQINDVTESKSIIKTGFDDFDTTFGGFHLGEFVVVGGRPAMGKTQLLVWLALNISKQYPTLFVTYDLSEYILTNRFLSAVSGIPVSDMLNRTLDSQQKVELGIAGKEFAERNLLIHDSSNTSIESLKALCDKSIRENGTQVVFIDFLQAINTGKYRSQREIEVSFISRELKKIARQYNVCVVVSSQLSRAPELRYVDHTGRRPQLIDLRESGAIEQDADKVLFIYRPEYYKVFEDNTGNSTVNLIEIVVAKNRNGKLGEFFLTKDNEFTTIQNYKKNFEFLSDRLLELNMEIPF